MEQTFTFRSPWFHLLIISVLCIGAYANTFSVPFHFDDKLNIVDNADIRDPGKFWPPSGTRGFGYLTFALNYRFGGLDPAGYHAVNLLIHVLSSLLVYWLVQLTLRTPYYGARRQGSLLPLFVALLFAAHPVQTQAVTYIVQRFASLAAFLYLLSLACYSKARLVVQEAGPEVRGSGKRSAAWYAGALLAALLAMRTKEISFTLPLVIVLYECFFFPKGSEAGRSGTRKWPYLLPMLMTLLVVPLALIGFGSSFSLRAFNAASDITRTDYLLTQFKVIVTYLRLLALPVGQSIDYDFPVSHSFFEPAVLLSFLVLAGVVALGIFLTVRSRTPAGPERLIAFGIFWFFITLSVESSIIPISDVIFEHRLYLPSVGAFMAACAAAQALLSPVAARHPRGRTLLLAAAASIVLTLAGVSFVRNSVWQSEIGLWANAVRQQPGAFRAWNMLGNLLKAQGRIEEAMNAYQQAMALNPRYAEAHVNMGRMYADLGNPEAGMREFMTALKLGSLDEIDMAILYINMGNYYFQKGMFDRAIEFYNYAMPMTPADATVYFYLGKAYRAKGAQVKASEYFSRAHRLNPERY